MQLGQAQVVRGLPIDRGLNTESGGGEISGVTAGANVRTLVYTVPANRVMVLTHVFNMMLRTASGGVVGESYINIEHYDGVIYHQIGRAFIYDNAVNAFAIADLSCNILLDAGDQIFYHYYDTSTTTSAHRMNYSYFGHVYDK